MRAATRGRAASLAAANGLRGNCVARKLGSFGPRRPPGHKRDTPQGGRVLAGKERVRVVPGGHWRPRCAAPRHRRLHHQWRGADRHRAGGQPRDRGGVADRLLPADRDRVDGPPQRHRSLLVRADRTRAGLVMTREEAQQVERQLRRRYPGGSVEVTRVPGGVWVEARDDGGWTFLRVADSSPLLTLLGALPRDRARGVSRHYGANR